MKKSLLLSIVLLFLSVFFAANEVMAFNTYEVGEITGQEYNDVWKKWFNREFSIWVGVGKNIDNKDTEYIYFKGTTGIGDATVRVQSSEATIKKIKRAVEKAIEWADIARKNRADTSKGLLCFMGRSVMEDESCEGYEENKNQMGISFFAVNSGKQNSLIIKLIDYDNQFIKTSLYFDLLEMKKLLKVIGEIENTFKKAHKTARDQNLFK